MPRRQPGFSLMELLVTLVIAAILAAFAIPLYGNYVKDRERRDARRSIETVATAEQVYYLSHPDRTYITDHFVPHPERPGSGQRLECDLTAALSRWEISVASADSDGFTVIATGLPRGPAAGLTVKYTHSRSGGSRWEES
jgi:type IV pilus assembly protein PilE